MNSFYGGPNGQSFEIKAVFTSKNGLTNSLANDLSKGWTSPISVGEHVVVSYGMPNDEKFNEYRKIDLDKEGKGYNSTLWRKAYDESQGSANGLYYELIASMTGNTPQILVEQPSGVLDADEEPYVFYDGSNIDQPLLKFFLPQSQVLQQGTTEVLNVNQPPEVVYDDTDINKPVITFKLPQSQVIEQAVIEQYLDVNQKPQVLLDITDINKPILKFQLPVAQQLLEQNVTSQVLDADGEPRIVFDTTNINEPTLTFYLPQSQVMDAPTTIVVDPMTSPSVSDIGTVNEPKLQFELPRAIRFYYGSLLGERTAPNGIYTLTNAAFADYGVGDYYINAATGFIYVVTAKTGNQCTFQYVASIQAPLPDVAATGMSPYTASGDAATPTVTRTFTNDQMSAWRLDFTLPRAPVPAVTHEFVGAAEDGGASVNVTDPDTITFDFKIPAGSRMFAGTEVSSGHYDTVVAEAKPGDMYLNGDTGEVYTLNRQGIWELQKGSLKGPVGDALNVVREYRINITPTLADNLANGVAHIQANYVDTNGDPLPYSPDELFAITWIDDEGKETSYWYFYTEEGNWARVQLTSGVLSIIETTYNPETDGPVDNKTYSISYINKLIGGNIDLDNMDKTAFSKDQIYDLMSWGTWQDAIDGIDIPEPENQDTLSAEEVIALMSWGSIASLMT